MRKLLRSLFYITTGWLIATFDKEAEQELADLLDRDALDNYRRKGRVPNGYKVERMPVHSIESCTLVEGGIAGAHVPHTEQQWSFNVPRFGRLVAVFLNQRDHEARILAVRIGADFVFQCGIGNRSAQDDDGPPDWADASAMLNQLGKVVQPGHRVVVYLDRKVSACRLCFELEPVEFERGVNEVAEVSLTPNTDGMYEVQCHRCRQRTKDASFDSSGWLCSDCKADIAGNTKGWCPRCNRYTVDLLTWHKGGLLCSDCKNVVIKG